MKGKSRMEVYEERMLRAIDLFHSRPVTTLDLKFLYDEERKLPDVATMRMNAKPSSFSSNFKVPNFKTT